MKQTFWGIVGHLISLILVSVIVFVVWNGGAHLLLPNQVPAIGVYSSFAIGLFLYFIHVVTGIYQTRLFFQKLEKQNQLEALRLDADIRYKLMTQELEAYMKGNLELPRMDKPHE